MNANLQRRIKRAEKAVDQLANPQKPKEVLLMAQPGPDASAEVIAKYEADMGAALERGAFVIELRPLQPPPRVDKRLDHWRSQKRSRADE